MDNSTYGDIAQLGERVNGIHEVSGSIPLISTSKISIDVPHSIEDNKLGDSLC